MQEAEGQIAAGHRASRGNALKHGLSAAVLLTVERERLDQLIALLAPDCEDKEVWHAAKRAAEAWIYCEKVSRARSGLIAATTGPQHSPKRRSPPGATDRLARYERRAAKQLQAALEILQLLLA